MSAGFCGCHRCARRAAFRGGGSTAELKPHPAPVLAALAALDRPAQGAVFIGDSPNDVEAARAAGLPVVCVTFGYRRCTAEELGADRLVDHFRDVPDAVAILLRDRAAGA